jgi:small subunit ribosomal protein S24e
LELKILEERKNPLLKRTEYRFEVTHGSAPTPTRDSVRQELAKATRTPKERLVVERMHASFGIARSEGLAVAYETKEALAATVREHIQIRNGLKEKPKPATEAPAAEPPAAEPAKAEAKKAEEPAPAPAKKE